MQALVRCVTSSNDEQPSAEKAGLKAQSKKLLTLIAAAGRKVNGQYAPIDPYCKDCGELKFQH